MIIESPRIFFYVLIRILQITISFGEVEQVYMTNGILHMGVVGRVEVEVVK